MMKDASRLCDEGILDRYAEIKGTIVYQNALAVEWRVNFCTNCFRVGGWTGNLATSKIRSIYIIKGVVCFELMWFKHFYDYTI